MLELQFSDRFALKAIGLLNTILPDGTPGFSLLIIITSEFSPMQLGFGFTLNGVGGLLGVNRTADVAKLTAGVQTGALASVLFPQDIVANAPQIISELRQLFPVAEGRYLFGPMAKLAWGTPPLIEAEIGVMVELPEPVVVLLPGIVRCVLPNRDNPVVKLQVNFLGTWEQQQKAITFSAKLVNSSILSMPLTGDMAFLMKYGQDPAFLFTAGGFHPKFTPPPLPWELDSRAWR